MEFVAKYPYHPKVLKDPYGRNLLRVQPKDVLVVIGPDDRGWSTGFVKRFDWLFFFRSLSGKLTKDSAFRC
jgi:hypothetical protein